MISAPIVSGVAGLLRAAGYTDVNTIRRRLLYTAKDLGSPGWDNQYGVGVVYPFYALDSTQKLTAISINNVNKYSYVSTPEFEIKATVLGDNFKQYTLEIGQGENPTVWQNTGITLTGGGLAEVENGTLGQLNMDTITEGIWTVKLKMIRKDNTFVEYKTNVYKRGAMSIYVDKTNMTGTEDGTFEHPFNTITEAIDSPYENIKIVVRPGVYSENVRIRRSNVELVGESPDTVFQVYCTWYVCPGIEISSPSPIYPIENIRVSNFTVEVHGMGSGVLVSGPTNNVTVEKIIVNQNVPRYCGSDLCEDVGIDVSYFNSNTTLASNVVSGFTYNYFIRGFANTDTKVYNNYSSKATWSGLQLGDLLGGKGLNVAGNTFISNRVNAIGMFGFPDGVIRDNVFVNNGAALYVTGTEGLRVYQNRFIHNSSYAGKTVASNATILFENEAGTIGNYWSDFDMPIEGAVDLDQNGVYNSVLKINDTSEDAHASVSHVNPARPDLVIYPQKFMMSPDSYVTIIKSDPKFYLKGALRAVYADESYPITFSQLSGNNIIFPIPSTVPPGLYAIDFLEDTNTIQTESYVVVVPSEDSSLVVAPSPTPFPSPPSDFGQAIQFYQFDPYDPDPDADYGTLTVRPSALTNIGLETTIDFWFKLPPEGEPQAEYGYGVVNPISKKRKSEDVIRPNYQIDIGEAPEYWGDFPVLIYTVRFDSNAIAYDFINKPLVFGKWNFLRMIRDHDTFSLYMDGEKLSEKTVSDSAYQSDISELLIGCGWIEGFNVCMSPFLGEMDEVRISHTVRDGTEVPTGPMALDDMTSVLYRFDGTTTDETPNNLDAVLSGNATYSNYAFVRSTAGLPFLPLPTATVTPISTVKPTSTLTPTLTPTNTRTPTPTKKPTATLTPTFTPTKTLTPTPWCTPSAEICDQKENDCDGQVDEGLVCQSPTPTKPSSIRPSRFPTLISVAPITARPTIRPITPVIRPTVTPPQVYHSVCGTSGKFLGIGIPSCIEVPGPGVDQCQRAFDCIRFGPVTQ